MGRLDFIKFFLFYRCIFGQNKNCTVYEPEYTDYKGIAREKFNSVFEKCADYKGYQCNKEKAEKLFAVIEQCEPEFSRQQLSDNRKEAFYKVNDITPVNKKHCRKCSDV